MTEAFEPRFKGIWASDFPYVLRMDGQTVTPQTVTWNSPDFIAHQADSPESLEFPICANRANRFARITPLRPKLPFYKTALL